MSAAQRVGYAPAGATAGFLASGLAIGLLVSGERSVGIGAHASSAAYTGVLVTFALGAGLAGSLARQVRRTRVPGVLVAVSGAAALYAASNGRTSGLLVWALLAGAAWSASVVGAAGQGRLPFGWVHHGIGAAVGGALASAFGSAHWSTAVVIAGLSSLGLGALDLLTSHGSGVVDDSEARRRVMATPTVRALMTVSAGSQAVLFVGWFRLLERLQDKGFGSLSSVAPLAAVTFALGALLVVRRGAREPAAAARLLVAECSACAGLLLVAAVSPGPLAALAAVSIAGSLGMVTTLLYGLALESVPPEVRPMAGAMLAVWGWLFGVLLALPLTALLVNRFGAGWSIGLMTVPALLALRAARRVRTSADADVSRVQSSSEEAARVAAGGTPKLLECSGIDFSYGPVQVLFDVNFTVDEGEMIALLGTNGAGKSTLLRVVSGLGIPTRGAVRFRGEDVTFLDPDRRLVRGIAQIPGGKAVFGTLSVVDNLRAFAFTLGGHKADIDRGIDESFAAFPKLAERRNQSAATLSGGEQQMLALCKAFLLKPRLLLIDELSLGLAPKIVGELLAMVRTINATGTAVVLVEQSVNVALSLVHHAYFMEKGAVQFDGKADDLLARGDLLRSVFLEGAAKGINR